METVGSLADKISICGLKIYHMKEQLERKDRDETFLKECSNKLNILNMQYQDLIEELNQLVNDIASGNKKIKVYRQMKMYNDNKYRK